MKLLKKMLLIKWYYIEHQIINFDNVNFMTGKNGSGKSTIIDAMQIVMLGDTRGTFFNKAANDRGGRTLDGYLKGEKLTISSQTKGSYINAYTIENMENIELKGINKIIFIENKANYIDYIEHKKENELVIYHGGFYSPIKGKLFEKIYNTTKNKKIKYCHWSDIDIGGIKIYTRLRDNIIPDLHPYKMDKQDLIENKKYAQTIDAKYKKMLENLKQEEKYSIFYDTIDYMLENNIKLEQESMINCQ